MAIEYLGLSSINGPLVVLEGVENAFYDEIVEFIVDHDTRKMGRIVELDEDKAVIQVFEGTENMSLDNTHTRLTGHPMEVAVSEEMLGRTFNGIGEAIDGLGPITDAEKRDVNGLPLNPVRREYPRNYIRTGSSGRSFRYSQETDFHMISLRHRSSSRLRLVTIRMNSSQLYSEQWV